MSTGTDVTFTSLQGLPWTFSWRTNVAGTGGYLILKDLYTVTYDRGFLDVEGDILNTAKTKWCSSNFYLYRDWDTALNDLVPTLEVKQKIYLVDPTILTRKSNIQSQYATW